MAQQVGQATLPKRPEALLVGEPHEAVEEGIARDGAIPDQLVCILSLKNNLHTADGAFIARDTAATSRKAQCKRRSA